LYFMPPSWKFHWLKWLMIDGKAVDCTLMWVELKYHALQNVLLLAGESHSSHPHPHLNNLPVGRIWNDIE
jgi:hypothetical protein